MQESGRERCLHWSIFKYELFRYHLCILSDYRPFKLFSLPPLQLPVNKQDEVYRRDCSYFSLLCLVSLYILISTLWVWFVLTYNIIANLDYSLNYDVCDLRAKEELWTDSVADLINGEPVERRGIISAGMYTVCTILYN